MNPDTIAHIALAVLMLAVAYWLSGRILPR